MQQLTDKEREVMSKCALCGEHATSRRNEHVLFECTAASVVKLRRKEGVQWGRR